MFRKHPGLNKQVLVTLFSGNAVMGVLTSTAGKTLIMRGCSVHEPGVDPMPADGEIVIDTANVDYIQIP